MTFEYTIVRLNQSDFTYWEDRYTDELNKLGSEGWEIAAISEKHDVIIMKRMMINSIYMDELVGEEMAA